MSCFLEYAPVRVVKYAVVLADLDVLLALHHAEVLLTIYETLVEKHMASIRMR
jgi:hypothetical protein